jgi:CheY-like chemotaxis protein
MAERRLRILIVEDEMLVAMNIEDMLLDLGHEVAGLASRLEPALSLAQEADFDGAMLDVNLAGEPSLPGCQDPSGAWDPVPLRDGYGIKGIVEEYRAAPVLQKPFRAADLGQALKLMLEVG